MWADLKAGGLAGGLADGLAGGLAGKLAGGLAGKSAVERAVGLAGQLEVRATGWQMTLADRWVASSAVGLVVL